MMAACQCPEYLKEHFIKNVHPDYPGVRYDIEDGNNALVTTTTLAKEITGFTQSVKAEINNKNFGFIFGSENVKFNGIPVERLTVYKARSLASDGTAFEPIFQTQVETYFDRVFRQATSDYKQDNIISFFSSNPSSQMSQWLNNKHWLNAIIQQGMKSPTRWMRKMEPAILASPLMARPAICAFNFSAGPPALRPPNKWSPHAGDVPAVLIRS